MIPSSSFRAAVGSVLLLLLATPALSQNTLIPLTTRRDMVFDVAGEHLYISTTEGVVRRFNISSGAVDASYTLGGSLNGLDIAVDGSFLLVAQNATSGSQGVFHRLDLATGLVTNIGYTRASGEIGAWDVAIAANGIALVTTQFSGSGSVPLWQIDTATNQITRRSDMPGSGPGGWVSGSTHVHRSASRSRLYFMEPGSSSGPVFTYDAAANSFGPAAEVDTSLSAASGAVDRSGVRVVTRRGTKATVDSAPAFRFERAFRSGNGGAAFDAQKDHLYLLTGETSEVVAFHSITGAELYRLPVGESVSTGVSAFGSGVLVASADGRFLAVSTPSGIRILTLPTTLPPPVPPTFGTPRDLVFARSGMHLYISTAEGLVWRHHLATNTLQGAYDLGGTLGAADIAPDDSYLLVAQQYEGVAQGAFQKLNLATGEVTNLTYARTGREGGAWDVAIGSGGIALASTDFLGSGTVPLRQIDLSTGALAIRADAPGSSTSGNIGQRLRSIGAQTARACISLKGISPPARSSLTAQSRTASARRSSADSRCRRRVRR